MSGDVMVQIALDDLCEIKTSAACSTIYKEERDKLQKKLAEATQEADAAKEQLAEWTNAVNAAKPEADAYQYLAAHDTPFEAHDVDEACDIIRALLAKIKAKKTEVDE